MRPKYNGDMGAARLHLLLGGCVLLYPGVCQDNIYIYIKVARWRDDLNIATSDYPREKCRGRVSSFCTSPSRPPTPEVAVRLLSLNACQGFEELVTCSARSEAKEGVMAVSWRTGRHKTSPSERLLVDVSDEGPASTGGVNISQDGGGRLCWLCSTTH